LTRENQEGTAERDDYLGYVDVRVRICDHVLLGAAIKRGVTGSAVMPPWNAFDMYA